jgi:hypothetical protein
MDTLAQISRIQWEELPAGETERPKSGQKVTGQGTLTKGKPCKNCELGIFLLGTEPAVQL